MSTAVAEYRARLQAQEEVNLPHKAEGLGVRMFVRVALDPAYVHKDAVIDLVDRVMRGAGDFHGLTNFSKATVVMGINRGWEHRLRHGYGLAADRMQAAR